MYITKKNNMDISFILYGPRILSSPTTQWSFFVPVTVQVALLPSSFSATGRASKIVFF